MQAMIARWGRTTQRVVPLSRLGESSDFHDSLSRASPLRDHRLHALQPMDRLQATAATANLVVPSKILGPNRISFVFSESARATACR
jgi:hypothetical protein